MNPPNPVRTIILLLPKSVNWSPLQRGLVLIALALVWFALSSAARAVLPSPTPDGGYPNENTAEGSGALHSLTDGFNNTAIGSTALNSDTHGFNNTATGSHALFNNTIGNDNTATGSIALFENIIGNDNTANGFQALLSNTADNNTATGSQALVNNTTGSYNTASGVKALYTNQNANYNTATGSLALLNNTGAQNTATGTFALQTNNTGQNNTATGLQALFNNTGGNSNTAEGMNALLKNTTGSNNIALGASAGSNLTIGSNNIDIGAPGTAGESGKIRIGKQGTQNGTFIAGISGVSVTGAQVFVNSNGKLGVATSSARFKEAIKPMDKASEAILALKPVTFRYKEELDPDKIPQFGLVAEEVEKVNPDLVVRGEDGKVMTVRYEAVNAMLLNEFLKEHQNVAEQQSTIAELKTTVAQQQKQLEALSTGLEKVNKQLQPSSSAPQIAANDY
jgi:uncharacterized coiled-coil protein SlyX